MLSDTILGYIHYFVLYLIACVVLSIIALVACNRSYLIFTNSSFIKLYPCSITNILDSIVLVEFELILSDDENLEMYDPKHLVGIQGNFLKD